MFNHFEEHSSPACWQPFHSQARVSCLLNYYIYLQSCKALGEGFSTGVTWFDLPIVACVLFYPFNHHTICCFDKVNYLAHHLWLLILILDLCGSGRESLSQGHIRKFRAEIWEPWETMPVKSNKIILWASGITLRIEQNCCVLKVVYCRILHSASIQYFVWNI